MEWAIQTFALSKIYSEQGGLRSIIKPTPSKVPAVDNVSFAVNKGELFGLLGPNGAGKTTLIKMLSTLILPTTGTAFINGFSLKQEYAIKASIGLVTSDERSFYWRLTGRQNLDFFAHLHGLSQSLIRPRIEEVLAQTGLEEMADKRFLTFSAGMRQRLSIARALINRPSLLFLDEPTKGLDPTATRNLQNLIREKLVNERGMTVFLTTHDLEEAARLCDRIAIMHKGKIRACGSLDDLRSELDFGDRYLIKIDRLPEPVKTELRKTIERVDFESPQDASDIENPQGASLRISAQPGERLLNEALSVLHTGGVEILDIKREAASLDSIFAHYTRLDHLLPGRMANGDTEIVEPAPLPSLKKTPTNASLPLSRKLAWAFLKRDLISEASYPVSFLLQVFGIFFSVGVFYFISQVVGTSAAPLLAQYGGDYFSFVLIGIAFNSYFSVGISSFAGSVRQAQTTGTLEALLATPARLSAIVIGSSLWDYVLTSVRVFIYLAVGVIVMNVDLGKGNYGVALLALVLTIIAFSGIGIISASFIMVLKRGDPVTWAFSAFSNLVGGVFYPISVLPLWLQIVARVLPITYGLEAMRLSLLAGAGLRELRVELLALAAFSIVLLPLSLRAFRFAVRRAKIDGSLIHY